MTPFEDFFDRMFVINRAARRDRMDHFNAEMASIGVSKVERFEAIDYGPTLGNHSCTASHRAVLDIICSANKPGWFHIFEDDATVREQFRGNFQDTFKAMAREVPSDAAMFYTGGHYGTNPRGWHSRHLILIGQMKTTSSYGVTLESARILRDLIPVYTSNAIDSLYAGFNETAQCFICEPRLFVQYASYSDLQRAELAYEGSMIDPSHVAALGKYHPK